MKTQTDRKIAEELQRTYEAQREAQMHRQELERETAVANMQAEVVRSEQEVRIAERNAASAWSRPRVTPRRSRRAPRVSAALRVRARRKPSGACAPTPRPRPRARSARAKAEALPRRAWARSARRDTPRCSWRPRSAENKVKLVPEIAVGGGQGGGRSRPRC